MSEEIDFRVLFEQSPEVLLLLAPDAPRYTQIAASQARYAATMQTRESTIGVGIFELFPDNPDDPAASGNRNLRASLDRVLATRKADTMAVQRYDIRRADGSFETRYWSPRNIPFLHPDGTVRYILHLATDVTDLAVASEARDNLQTKNSAMERDIVKRSAELSVAIGELRQVNDKLGELDRAKTAFFSNVSHELRTPLTLMLAPLEDALEEQGLAAGLRDRLRMAHDNALRLLRLVNALLDFSRLQAGRLHATFAPLDLGVVTSELAGMFQSAAAKAHLKLTVECPPLREKVFVDRDLWEKIVPNLVSNALKYTHSGEVSVRCHEEPSQVVVTVSDTGIGIPEAALPRIFERFFRVEGAVGRTHEGTGIGLSLVRELVELHGGHVSVASVPGKGTTFRVEIPKGYAHLPIDEVSQAPVAPGSQRDTRTHTAEAHLWIKDVADTELPARDTLPGIRHKVLVVDDNADLRAYIEGLLASAYAVTTAGDGREALEAIKKSMPDLVVSDVMMPHLDGIGLVKALRADPATSSIPVILLSARVGEESAVEGLDAGADDYVAKPFTARELLARVRTHVELAVKRKEWVQELTRINRELDAFSSSVSHDLRNPAGQMKGFAELLREDPQTRLSERGAKFVQHIESAATEMLSLIEHLLRLAQLSRQPLQRTGTDLSSMVDDVVAIHRHGAKGRKVEVRVAPAMQCECDAGLLRVVLDNLIANAFKYSSKRDEAHIEIGCDKDAEGDTVFYVRDDGAGFDASNAGKLFTPFFRMHGNDQFPGTGIGLATVHRIIDRHGGRIWVESEPDKGATFFFTLGQSPSRAAQ